MKALTKLANSCIKNTKTVRQLREENDFLKSLLLKHLTEDCTLELQDGTKIYAPNMMEDHIQRRLALNLDFYEKEILGELDEYFPENATILDVGANIGNHSLYWCSKKSAKKVYAFEPIQNTFSILKKNVEINGLEDKISLFNMGVGEKSTQGKIKVFRTANIGSTSIEESESGDLKIVALDELEELKDMKIDFIKIDVEGFEIFALKGALQLIQKNRPDIFIETFASNYAEVDQILKNAGYTQVKAFDDDNYLYQAK